MLQVDSVLQGKLRVHASTTNVVILPACHVNRSCKARDRLCGESVAETFSLKGTLESICGYLTVIYAICYGQPGQSTWTIQQTLTLAILKGV